MSELLIALSILPTLAVTTEFRTKLKCTDWQVAHVCLCQVQLWRWTVRKLVGGNCGLNSRNRNETNVVSLLSCKKDISGYKRCLGINNIDSEVELILARASIFSLPSDFGDRTVCPSHRYSLGIGWRRGSYRCRVPSGLSKHVQEGKSRKAETHRGISKALSRTILHWTGIFVATGSGMYDLRT